MSIRFQRTIVTGVLLGAACLSSLAVQAQQNPFQGDTLPAPQEEAIGALNTNPTEGDVPAPPAAISNQLHPISQSGRQLSSVQASVDLDSIRVDPDHVVRFVIVLQGQDGTRTSYYHGLRCDTWEARTYARYDGSHWETLNTRWSSMYDTPSAWVTNVARAGLCDNMTPPLSAQAARRAITTGNTSWMQRH